MKPNHYNINVYLHNPILNCLCPHFRCSCVFVFNAQWISSLDWIEWLDTIVDLGCVPGLAILPRHCCMIRYPSKRVMYDWISFILVVWLPYFLPGLDWMTQCFPLTIFCLFDCITEFFPPTGLWGVLVFLWFHEQWMECWTWQATGTSCYFMAQLWDAPYSWAVSS